MKRFALSLLLASSALFAQEIPVEEVEPLDWPSVQEYYAYMQEAIDDEDWKAAIDYGQIVLYNFPDSPLVKEIPFYLGMAYYKLEQYELSNDTLSKYLRQATSPKHFEEAIETKFTIAEMYREGKKKRLFGSEKMPAIVPAREDALVIYDEVITTLPHHEITTKALLGKAEVQAYFEDFKPSIETLQFLIRRFPKHESAAEAYLRINKVYLQECKMNHLDLDLLDLAEVNLRKFRLAFPREARVGEAEKALTEMQEVFAVNLLETGEFFQRRKQPDAAIIYFSKIVAKYPKSQASLKAREKLEELQAKGLF